MPQYDEPIALVQCLLIKYNFYELFFWSILTGQSIPFLSPKKKPHNLCSTLDPWIALPHFGFLEAEQKWRSPQLQKVCERIGLKQKRLKRISIWHPDNCHLAGHWVLSTNALESTLMICTLAFAPRSNRMSP